MHQIKNQTEPSALQQRQPLEWNPGPGCVLAWVEDAMECICAFFNRGGGDGEGERESATESAGLSWRLGACCAAGRGGGAVRNSTGRHAEAAAK